MIDEKDEDEGFDSSSSTVKMQEKDRFRLFKQSKKDIKCVRVLYFKLESFSNKKRGFKVKKQASVDSNYFSDPEVHVYEVYNYILKTDKNKILINNFQRKLTTIMI